MFASEVFLGVKPSAEYLYVLIASPVGSYFAGGVKPVTVWVSKEYTRAAPGGTGAAKCGGNYAASLVAQAEAIENGCDQVVFLDAVERRYVDELGGMNIFFVFDDGSLVDAAPDRLDPARHHPRRDHHAGQRGRPGGRRAPDQLRRVAHRRRAGPDHRGVRVRHRRRDHADRHGSLRRRRLHRSATAAPGRSPPRCGSRWSTSSAVGPRTGTAGSSASSDPTHSPRRS